VADKFTEAFFYLLYGIAGTLLTLQLLNKIDPMKKKESIEYFLPALLLVTGFCFLSFAMVLKILDGVNTKFFLRAGFTILLAGAFSGLCILIDKKTELRSRS
jgi:hypothetical protein